MGSQNKTWNSLFLDPFYYYPKNINQKVKKNEIRNILPNSVIKIAKISEKKILQKDGILNLLKTYPDNKKAAFNSFCMWKAIQSCNQMKIDFQQKKNIRYDYVVRIRPDWKLKKKLAILIWLRFFFKFFFNLFEKCSKQLRGVAPLTAK